jgi:MFS family permease
MSPEKAAILLNIPLATANAFGTFLSCLLIDKFGRRYLMLRSLPPICLTLLITAAGMLVEAMYPKSFIGTDVAFAGLVMFVISFGIGFSSTPWCVNAEIYPLHVIGTAASLATFTNWMVNFVVATAFPLALKTEIGSYLSFVFLAVMAALAWVFVYFLLPETANKEITQILKEMLGSSYKPNASLVGVNFSFKKSIGGEKEV